LAGQWIPVATYPVEGANIVPRAMTEAADGNIWVTSDAGLYRLVGDKLVETKLGIPKLMSHSLVDFGGSLWVASTAGLYRVKEGKASKILDGAIYAIAHHAGELYFTYLHTPGLYQVRQDSCLSLGTTCVATQLVKDGHSLASTGADGRLWFPCGREICTWSPEKTLERRGPRQGVPAMDWEECLVDRDGTLWASTRYSLYHQPRGSAALLPDPDLTRVAPMSSLLLGRRGDMLAFVDSKLVLPGSRRVETQSFQLEDGMISLLYEGQGGELWVGSEAGGLLRLQLGGRLRVWNETHGLPNLSTNFMESESGAIWCSSKGVLSVLRPGESKWRSVTLPGVTRRVFPHDAGGGRIILSAIGEDLFEIDERSLRWERKDLSAIHSGSKSLLIAAGAGAVWIRPVPGGEQRIAIALPSGPQSLRNQVEDRLGRLWLVTRDGLVAVNPNGIQRVFTEKDGLRMKVLQAAAVSPDLKIYIGYDLPSDLAWARLPEGEIGPTTKLVFEHVAPARENEGIYSLGFDAKNRLWKGTASGMQIGDPGQFKPGVLGRVDWWTLDQRLGLPHPDVFMNSFLQQKDGSISFSTLKGRVRIEQPDELYQPGRLVRLNGLLENGLVRVATTPADAAATVKMEYREWSWPEFAASGWQPAPGLTFPVNPAPTGIEFRIVEDYFHRSSQPLYLGKRRPAALIWWVGVGIVAFLLWQLRIVEKALYQWRKRKYRAEEELPIREVGELTAGTLLKDRFLIGEVIAKGRFSDVFAATDHTQNGAAVVVKRLKLPEYSAAFTASWLKRRFMQEVGAAAMLRHPGILPVIDAWIEDPGVPYLVMRRVDGPTLRTYLNERGRLNQDSAALLLKALCGIVGEAHSRGVVHCDLKPENVLLELVDEHLQPLVIDFGTSALRLEASTLSHLTQPAGTVRYMAPEQLLGQYSTASDVYALALIAIEMFTGEQYADWNLAFDDVWKQNLCAKIVSFGVSEAAAQAIASGLRFNPGERENDLVLWCARLIDSLEKVC